MKLEKAFQHLEAGRKAKQLQSLWPTIEQKLAEGVSHAQILGALNENGLDLTERTYKSYLYRLRKRRRMAGQHLAPERLAERIPSQTPDAVSASCAPSAADGPKRPPTFEFDPRGISPDLLK